MVALPKRQSILRQVSWLFIFYSFFNIYKVATETPRELTSEELKINALHDLFDAYCQPPHEMDANMFKKLMRETYTLTKKYANIFMD
jgi:hypothetical protein